jgi:hypothetical protein
MSSTSHTTGSLGAHTTAASGTHTGSAAYGAKSTSSPAGGSGYGSPAYAAATARRDAANAQTAKTYAGVLCAFVVFFMVTHWVRWWFANRPAARGNPDYRPTGPVRLWVSVSR